ncbi:MAG: tetratricopeptide repeat protein [Armatimonadetes bacterium]|nr:tetratricopeptide repeat protein [Armatimonadota bacterium]
MTMRAYIHYTTSEAYVISAFPFVSERYPAKMTIKTSKCGRSLDDQAKGGATSRRFEVLAVAALLLIAIIIRVVYILQYKNNTPCYSAPMMDSQYYDLWAQRVASGEGYGAKPFYMAPLYPYVLAGIYRVFGHNYGIVYIFQMVLGIGNLVMVYLIGRRVFGHWAGVVGMLLVMGYGPVIYLETKLLTETLSIAIGLGTILVFMGAVGSGRGVRYLLGGILAGLGAICRANMIIFGIFVLGWVLISGVRGVEGLGRGIRSSVLVLAGMILVVGLVGVRNYVVGRDVVMISSNAGINFAQGNLGRREGIFTYLEGFSGSIITQEDEERRIASREVGHIVKASESSRYWIRETIRYMRGHIGETFLLWVRKVIWVLHGREAPCNYNIYLEREMVWVLRYLFVPYWMILGLGMYGFVRGIGRGSRYGISLVGLYILSIFVTLVIFSVSSRFRAPMVPALGVFAGYGFTQAISGFSKRCVGVLAVCLGLPILISLIPYPVPLITSEALANLGVSYLSLGDVKEAEKRLEEALEVDPDFAYAHVNLGTALAMQGRMEEAANHFLEALRIYPSSVEAHSNLGSILAMQGKFDEALRHFAEAAHLNPNSAEVLNNLGNVLAKLGDLNGAAESYSKALKINPRFSQAHASLGNILMQQGRINEAIEHFESALEANPDDITIHYKLANLLLRLRRFDEAIKHYREILKRNPEIGRVHNNLAVALFFNGDYAEAWKEVRLSERYGVKPAPGFIEGLAKKMPEP